MQAITVFHFPQETSVSGQFCRVVSKYKSELNICFKYGMISHFFTLS